MFLLVLSYGLWTDKSYTLDVIYLKLVNVPQVLNNVYIVHHTVQMQRSSVCMKLCVSGKDTLMKMGINLYQLCDSGSSFYIQSHWSNRGMPITVLPEYVKKLPNNLLKINQVCDKHRRFFFFFFFFWGGGG